MEKNVPLHTSHEIADGGPGGPPAGPEESHLLVPGGNPPHGGDPEYVDAILYPNPDDRHLAPIEFPRNGDQSPNDLGKVTTRIVKAAGQIGVSGGVTLDPVMLLPADPNRVGLHLSADPTVASQPYIIASSKDECYDMASSAALEWTDPYRPPVELFGHTGALWVYAPSATVFFHVAAFAVTF